MLPTGSDRRRNLAGPAPELPRYSDGRSRTLVRWRVFLVAETASSKRSGHATRTAFATLTVTMADTPALRTGSPSCPRVFVSGPQATAQAGFLPAVPGEKT